jgi:2-succinyl-5-enolpyruvyl-6-hydroxy-3-cyclohexene-1-carboxylate synthase
VFGTPHGTDLRALAAAAGLPYQLVSQAADLPAALGWPSAGAGAGEKQPTGLRLVEVRTSRSAGAALRASLSQAAEAAAQV